MVNSAPGSLPGFEAAEGSYQVVRVLGRGGFGTVYLARFTGPGGFVKEVALKVLNPGMEGIDEVAGRLRDEARMLGQLRHRAIVVVDRLTTVNGQWAVVMEYIEGADLRRVIKHEPLPARPAVEIIGEVAGALHAAYSRPGASGEPLKLIHRDIKPSNIQITPYGEVKILDFGIARAEFNGREGVTHSLRFGTPEYMSPERLDTVDGPEGDVYALGAVLYESLTGRLLGRTSSRQDKHRVVEDVALAELRERKVHREVVALVRAMIAWDPSSRPTARDVERQVGGLLDALRDDPLRDWAERVVPLVPPPSVTSLNSIGTPVQSGASAPSGSLGSNPVAPVERPGAGARGAASSGSVSEVLRDRARQVIGAGVALGLVGVGLGVSLWMSGQHVTPPEGEGAVASADTTSAGATSATTTSTAVPAAAQTPEVTASSEQARTPPSPELSSPSEPPSGRGGGAPASGAPAAVGDKAGGAAAAGDRSDAGQPREPTGRRARSVSDDTPARPPAPVIADRVVVQATKVSVGLEGDATSVVLGASGASYTLPGEVPPGTYTARASFPAWGSVTAGRVTISGDKAVTVRCLQDTTTCTVR